MGGAADRSGLVRVRDCLDGIGGTPLAPGMTVDEISARCAARRVTRAGPPGQAPHGRAQL